MGERFNELPTLHLSFTALFITWMMYSAFRKYDCQTLVQHMKMSVMSLNIAQINVLHHAGMFCKYRYLYHTSPRFLCRLTAFMDLGSQSAIYTKYSGFASPALGRHISTFRGYRILFSIINPYINRFTNHFSIHS